MGMGLFKKRPRYFDFARHRKPVVILREFISAIVGAIATFISTFSSTVFGVAIGGTVYGISGGTIIAIVATTALTALTSALTTQSNKPRAAGQGGMLVNSSNVTDVKRIICGKTRTGGSRVFVHTTGGVQNKVMWVCVIWCVGPVKGIVTDGAGPMIWLGDKRIQEFETWRGRSWIWHYFHDGSMTQNIDADLAAAFPQWADAQRGSVFSIFKLKYNGALYTSFPEFTCLMEGLNNVYDPRDGSHGYTRNPGLFWRHFMTDPRDAGGIKGSLINKQSVIDAANWCDANGYYFDGAVLDRQEFLDNFQDIEMNFRAETIWSGGEYKLVIQKYATPVLSLDERDIQVDEGRVNAIGIATAGIQDAPRRIKVTFFDPVDNYMPKYTYWPTAPSAAEQTDREWREIVLIGTADFAQALKAGKYFYIRAQFDRQLDTIAHPRLSSAELSDLIQMSHNSQFPVQSIPEDWANKVLRINSLGINQAQQIAIAFIEEDPSIYDDTVDVAAHQAFSTDLPQPGDVAYPDSLGYNTGSDESTVRAVDAYVEFYWGFIEGTYNYDLRWRYSDSSRWTIRHINMPHGEVGLPLKTATGTLTLQTSGDYSADTNKAYRIEIDGDGSPNTFKWSDTGGVTWNATGVPVVAGWIDLNNDVQIMFNALTGGVIGDFWDFTCIARDPITFREGKLRCGATIYWQVRAATKDGKSEWVTTDAPIITWAPSSLDISSVSLAAGISRGRVILSWLVPDQAVRIAIVKWHIYRNQTGTPPSTDEEFNDQEIDEVADRNRAKCSYTDKFASMRNVYYYWIRGEDAFGNLSELSNAASINVTLQSPEVTLEQVTTDPALDNTIVVKTDSLELSDMDDYTQWATDSAVPGSIVLSQETVDVAEGTGALKAEIYRYPKRVCFEGGVTENFFGRQASNKMITQRFRAPGEFTGSSGSGVFNAGNYIANNTVWTSATKKAKIIAVFGTAAAPQIIYSLISGSDFTNGETITEFIYSGAYAASDGSCTAGTPLSDTVDIKAIALKVRKAKGSPGDITAALYSDNAGAIGTLLNTANAISASGISNSYPAVPQDFTWGIFNATTALTRHSYYWGVFTVAADSFLNYYSVQSANFNVDQDTATHLAIGASMASYTSYPGYDLMFRAGIAGDALNKYIYDTIGAIDISAKTYQKSYVKSANDIGNFIDHAFGEAAISEQVLDFGSISQINTWLLVKSAISWIAAASRDAVTKVGYKILNTDKDRIFFFDIMFCNVGEVLVQIKVDGSMRTIPYDNAETKVEIMEEFIGYVANHVIGVDFIAPDYTVQQTFHGNEAWRELQTGLSATPPATMAVVGGASGILTVKGDGTLAPRVILGDGQKPFYGDKNPTVIIKQAQASAGAATRRIGLMDGVPTGDAANCISWRYTAGGNYIAVCREGSVESTIDTAIAAADAQFDTLKFVDVGGSVEFFVNDVSKGSINSNVPDSEPMYFAMGADNVTSGRGLHVDKVQIIQDV